MILNPYEGWPLVKVPSTPCLNVTGYVRAVEGKFGKTSSMREQRRVSRVFRFENLNDLPGIEELKATGLLEKGIILRLSYRTMCQLKRRRASELFPLGYEDALGIART